jgi:molecular chaperone GrpE
MEKNKSNRNREIVIPVSGSEGKNVSRMDDTLPDKKGDSEAADKDYLDQLQRLQAEFSNYRKRVEKERETLFSIAKGEIVSKLLTVLDDFERMVDHHQKNGQCSIDGVNLIYQNFKKVLSEEGLEVIPSIGERFDPDFHEAVGVEKTEEDRDGLVVEEWQKGYRFGGKLLRPSRVKVGRHIQEAGDN